MKKDKIRITNWLYNTKTMRSWCEDVIEQVEKDPARTCEIRESYMAIGRVIAVFATPPTDPDFDRNIWINKVMPDNKYTRGL